VLLFFHEVTAGAHILSLGCKFIKLKLSIFFIVYISVLWKKLHMSDVNKVGQGIFDI